MFQITLDVFSGRENPSTFITGQDAHDLAVEFSRNRGILTDGGAGFQGLGFRGVVIEPTNDTITKHYDLPQIFKIGGGSSGNEAKAQEIAERLCKKVIRAGARDSILFPQDLEKTVLQMLASTSSPEIDTESDAQGAPGGQAARPGDAAVTCQIEVGKFNPGLWNDPNYIRRNNCYNYASNKRTNTFAQPGRGSSHMYAKQWLFLAKKI
jgi:hypothetical protein